jgi:hypothetical protein
MSTSLIPLLYHTVSQYMQNNKINYTTCYLKKNLQKVNKILFSRNDSSP